MSERHILFCNCSFNSVTRADTRRAVLEALESAGVGFTVVDDLCRLAAQHDTSVPRLAAGSLTIAACHPRAVRALLAAAGVDTKSLQLQIIDMRSADPEAALSALNLTPSGDGGVRMRGGLEPQGEWEPWFPVIDPDRCVNCRQCLNFCLFGVYELSPEGRVTVAKPANCKTNCPACARICPEVAIIFPKYPDGPISGAEIRDENIERSNVKLNVEKMLGGDLRAALKRRSRMRRARLLDPEKMQRAFARSEGTPDAESEPGTGNGPDREGQ